MKIPYEAIWRTLHERAGANERMPLDFPMHWPDCREYRFMGKLGFGGKVWSYDERWFVTCYRENETPERVAMIEATNADLAALREEAKRPPSPNPHIGSTLESFLREEGIE